jgi:hypothetical protein
MKEPKLGLETGRLKNEIKPPNILDEHYKKYKSYKPKKIDPELIFKIEDEISPIHCFKFNYSLDSEVQKFTSFQALIEIEGDEITVINRKPDEADQFILEADPDLVKEA